MAKDITGQRFHRLVAIRPTERRQSKCVVWECLCDCGNTCFRNTNSLMFGNEKACGCMRNEMVRERSLKHGQSKTKLHNVWLGMRDRCNNPANRWFKNYGGRGIKVCARWDNFELFRDDMGPRQPRMMIERINNNGDYTPDNCRWATNLEQSRNKRTNVWINIGERSMILGDWTKLIGALPGFDAYYRKRYGLDKKAAILHVAARNGIDLKEETIA
jgi:hypothetical protein